MARSVNAIEKDLKDWKWRERNRRVKYHFYHVLSKRPKAERKKLADKWLANLREAEKKVAALQEELDHASGRALAMRYYASCNWVSGQRRPYVYGGGHGPRYASIGERSGLDCSSSTWYALRHAGFIAGVLTAPVSGAFGSLPGMDPGPGKYITIYYSGNHVWSRFHGLGNYWRFDTSPWGSGGSGPRMRTGPRSTSGFRTCHPRGL